MHEEEQLQTDWKNMLSCNQKSSSLFLPISCPFILNKWEKAKIFFAELSYRVTEIMKLGDVSKSKTFWNILSLYDAEILNVFCRGEIQLLEKGYQRAVLFRSQRPVLQPYFDLVQVHPAMRENLTFWLENQHQVWYQL